MGRIPTCQRRGLGTSKDLDPQHLPQSKEQAQALLHSAVERGWELRQEKGEKGEKKLNFTSETVLVTGSLSPTCSRAQAALAPRPPFPVRGARELLAARGSRGTGRVVLRVAGVSPGGHAGAGEAAQYLPQPGGRGPRGSLSDGAPED